MEAHKVVNAPTHHAYIIFDYEIDKEKILSQENVHLLHFEKGLVIDDVRDINIFVTKGLDTENRKIVILTPTITHQAQNALLKIIEETPKGIFFFLCVPTGIGLLDTLLSRCYLINKHANSLEEVSNEFSNFIKLDIKNRMKFLDDIWENDEGKKYISVMYLLQDLEKYTHKKILEKNNKDDIKKCMEIINKLRNGISGKGFNKTTLQILAFL